MNGITYYSAISLNKVDPIYPKEWGNSSGDILPERADSCKGHPDDKGNYHYHIPSPCILNTTFPGSKCANVAGCQGDTKDYLVAGMANFKKRYVIGIAKDGHLLYAPYDNNGKMVNCSSLDTCNGKTLDDKSYGYFATTTFPYGISCWGPGEPAKF